MITPTDSVNINFSLVVTPEGAVNIPTPVVGALTQPESPRPLDAHKVEPVKILPDETKRLKLNDLRPKAWNKWTVRSLMFAIAAIVAVGAVMGYHYGVNNIFNNALSVKQWLILGGLGAVSFAITSYVLYNIHHYFVKVHEKAPESLTDSSKLVRKNWWEKRSWEEKGIILLVASVGLAYFLTAAVIAAYPSIGSPLDFLATPWNWIGSTFQPGQISLYLTAYSVAVPVIGYLAYSAYKHRNDDLSEKAERNIEDEQLRSQIKAKPPELPAPPAVLKPPVVVIAPPVTPPAKIVLQPPAIMTPPPVVLQPPPAAPPPSSTRPEDPLSQARIDELRRAAGQEPGRRDPDKVPSTVDNKHTTDPAINALHQV